MEINWMGKKAVPPTTEREKSAEKIIRMVIDLYEGEEGDLETVAGQAWAHYEAFMEETLGEAESNQG